MTSDAHRIIAALAEGRLSAEEACRQVDGLLAQARGFDDLGFAKPDVAREGRQGAGEVVFGEGKTAAQIADIAHALLGSGQRGVLATRVDKAKAGEVRRLWEEADPLGQHPVAYHEVARLLVLGRLAEPTGAGAIVVASAGTSDLAVAEEAALTAEFLGNEVRRCYDVGVAGMHRLLADAGTFQDARAIVAVAGMEGALPSVIAGLVSCPVIAVPTSVGYGASFGGIAALLGMLNTCASGVSVVNIDNGFGAAYQASLINHG